MKSLSCIFVLCYLAGFAHAEMGLVREYIETNGVPQRISESPMAIGANYETEPPPVYAGYIFTHWTMNVEGATRDALGRAYDRLPYHLTNRIDLTAHYLPSDQDSDGDGVADGYEIYWYGNLGQGADSDTDGDGLTFAEELANGTNPLMANGEVEGSILYADGEMTLYNPNGYAQFTISSETEGLVTLVDQTCRPGTSVSTPTLSPTASKFAYWTRNGEPVRDELGRAIDGITLTIGEAVENFVAVGVADYDTRMKLYWYGDESVGMDSDTDGDGFTFAQELTNGTNPLMADGEVEGSVRFADAAELVLYNPYDYQPVAVTEADGVTVKTNSCELTRPGMAVSTGARSPMTSNFAYWTRNGVPCRDELGRALDEIVFTMGKTAENLEAVLVGDANARQKLYWYGTTEVSMESDTDGDGRTFAEEIAAGTNPLMADGDVEGPVQVADGRLLLYDPFGTLDVCVATATGYEEAYDGQEHGISVTVLRPTSGTTLRYGLSDSGPFSATMPTFKDVGTYVIWYEVAALDYETLVDCAEVKITKGSLPPDVDPDPVDPDPTKPDGPYSAFDYVGAYDGEGHTIDTNGLAAAYRAAVGEGFTVSYAIGENGGFIETALPWTDEAPVFTNAATNVVWYKVSSANYEDIVHPAKVAIVPRAMSSVSVSDPGVIDYTGMAITPSVTVSDGAPSIVKTSDYTISYADNVHPGTARIILTATATGNYTGTKTVPFTIRKTTFDIDDGTGGEGGKNSKFSYSGVYDGLGHGINVQVDNPPTGVLIKYSRGQPDKAPGGTWSTVNPLYTNVCDNVVWYAVECAGYISYTNNATVTITAKPLTVKAEAKTQVYGEEAKPLTYTTVGLCSGDALTGALTRESGGDAGEYAILQGTLANGNYTINYAGAKYTITKAKYPGNIQWNVAADAATWMYDGSEHGVTLTGVPSGVTPHVTGNAAKDVGEYTASVTFDFDAANYEPPKAPAPLKWSITARPLSLQTVNAEKPYDGFPLTVDKANITPGLSGYAEGESFDYFDLASITEVGETPATFKYRDSASAKVSNYAVTVVGGATLKVTVGGDQISVTARDGTWAYDATDHRKMEWDIVNGDKLLAGHEFRIKIDEAKSVVKTPEDGPEHNGIVSNVFEYVRIVETESGADKTKNYNLFVYDGALKVTNACVEVEKLRGVEDVEKTYDGEPTNVTVTAELLQPATVRYFGDKDCLTAPRGEGTSGTVFTDAGEYVVWYTVAAQYYNTYTNKVAVKIGRRPITLTSPTKSKPFDGTALTFGAEEIAIGRAGSMNPPTGGESGGFVETALPEGESLVFSNFASIADAGRVDATFEYAAGADTSLDNYEVTVKKGTLTVNASAEEITVTAKSGSWPYDGEEHVLHDCEVENEDVLQDGDELVVEYDPASKVTTPDDGEVENVIASVRVMRGGEDGEDVTANYSIVTYPGKIKVVNATMTSEQVMVTSEECVYDGEGHTIGVEADGLLTSPVTVVYSATGVGAWKLDPRSVAVKNAGTHTIRYQVSAKYYNDYFGEATVKINPRPVTLLSGSATKVYDGTPLRKNEVKVKEGSLDFVDGEGVTTSCTSAQTGVGRIENGFSYEFKPGTLKDNYTIIPAFGWLEVTPGTLTVDPAKSGYNAPYDGKAHGPEVLAALSGLGFDPEACEIAYALVPGDESAYSPTMPTLTDVGTQTVYVKVKAQNFNVVYAEMKVTVVQKEITDEMVQPGEDAFFFDGDAKKPTVDVQYFVDGKDICKESDYTVTYGTKAGTGWWVTVTGKGNYSGTVTKIVPVLKRPVAPPLVPSKSYNGKTQKPTIPTDDRWTVVANPGGINVGEYANVVLRLTNTTDYKWKGGEEDQTEITLVFRVTRGSNRWTRQPDMKGWTYGETPSEPAMGQALHGTVKVAYRRKGAAVETETAERPSLPGKYLARFWVDETENFIGLATKSPYKEFEFEIVDPSGGGGETETTPVPVPHGWLDAYVAEFGGGDYETAANAKGRNGVALWESYVAGLDPTDAASQFKVIIAIGADGKPVITWEPDMSKADPPRTYVEYGKASILDADWTPVTDANRAAMRFFKVGVEIK